MDTKEENSPKTRVKTNIVGFDDLIGGGIPAGAVCLITGEPGTMKTSLAFSILYNSSLKPGQKSAYITLEQPKKCLLSQVASIGLKNKEAIDRISVVDVGTLRRNMRFPKGEESWLELIKMHVRDLVKTENVKVLGFDSLDVLETLAKFKDRRSELYNFFGWLRDLGLTSIVISERPTDTRDSHYPDEAYLADAVINVGLYPTSDVHVQRRIRCIKMRCTKHDTSYFTLVLEDGRFEITSTMSATS